MTVNSLNTKRTSNLEKSLSEKYMHIPGCQKSGAFHIPIKKNRVSHILFVDKRGLIIYLTGLKKGPFGTHIRTMLYIGSYPHPRAINAVSFIVFHIIIPLSSRYIFMETQVTLSRRAEFHMNGALYYRLVPNNSVSGLWKPWSDCPHIFPCLFHLLCHFLASSQT